VIMKLYDYARQAIADGLPDGPFRGVPFLLKDLTASLAGVRMTRGSRFFADAPPPAADSEHVKRLKQAGLVPSISEAARMIEQGGVKLDDRAGVVTALEVRDLSVELGRRRIVSGVRMDVEEGGWVCVIGPNGAGKTTLLHAIAGLLPRSGSVRLWGRPIGELGRRERARTIALVPQLPVIPEGFTVEQYALLGRTPHLGLLASEGPRDLEAVASALERLDLGVKDVQSGLREGEALVDFLRTPDAAAVIKAMGTEPAAP